MATPMDVIKAFHAERGKNAWSAEQQTAVLLAYAMQHPHGFAEFVSDPSNYTATALEAEPGDPELELFTGTPHGAVSYYAEKDFNKSGNMGWYLTLNAVDERGGIGDELTHHAGSDTFTYALGSGMSPTKCVRNPVPGDVLAGAAIVARQADKDWQ